MAEPYYEPLTPVDAAFLNMESGTEHMHVGGLFVFDESTMPGPFDFGDFVRLVRSRLHLVPRYRQKLAYAPFNLSNPVWIDDPNFDLGFHVRHASLPKPGTTEQLTQYAARILSRPLDRDRPLWELYVIEGLEDDRIALLGKTHHAMIDGVSGLDLATVMLDLTPDAHLEIPDPEPWEPRPAPSTYDLASSSVRSLVTSPREVVEAGRRLASGPLDLARKAFGIGRGVLGATGSVARPAPRSSLNVRPGQQRRFAIDQMDLEAVKTIKDAYGTTVNDVVLALVADATGRLLRGRGESTEGLWLRAMVPVSVRAAGDEHLLGNRVVSIFVNLPMAEMDPVERLQICHEAMKDVKDRHDAVGASFFVGMTQFTPPTIHAMASRLASRARLFNFLITNVPGPQVPIFLMGAKIIGAFPFSPLAATHSYAVGLTSLSGTLSFGITGDYDAMPDLADVTGYLATSLAELTASAEAVSVRGQLVRQSLRRGGVAGGPEVASEDGAETTETDNDRTSA